MRERPPYPEKDKDRYESDRRGEHQYPDDAKRGAATEKDPYESDRRGEHQYPDDAKHDAERPSQREREELKERLEKRG